jgi:hypothetical protein
MPGYCWQVSPLQVQLQHAVIGSHGSPPRRQSAGRQKLGSPMNVGKVTHWPPSQQTVDSVQAFSGSKPIGVQGWHVPLTQVVDGSQQTSPQGGAPVAQVAIVQAPL